MVVEGWMHQCRIAPPVIRDWRAGARAVRPVHRCCPTASGRRPRWRGKVPVRRGTRSTGGRRPDSWSVFWAAGIITSASASPASGESGLVVNAAILAPAFAAVSAALTTPEVVPDPEATRSRSPELIAGVVVSPATWTVRPRCISLMAAIRRTSPLRPAPATNTRPGLAEVSGPRRPAAVRRFRRPCPRSRPGS